MWGLTIDLYSFQVTLGQLLILAGFLGLVLGFFLAGFINRQRRVEDVEQTAAAKERATSNTAFMKGINYILADRREQAIEELTRAVAVDTETVETYVALANLFRSKGEIDRAVRIRHSIILRPGLDEKLRSQARLDLGLDYGRGGFFDRAVSTFEQLIAAEPGHIEAHVELIKIFEITREWDQALVIRDKLARLTGTKTPGIQAHYLVESGKVFFEKGLLVQARGAYKKALAIDRGCVDAWLHLGDLHLSEGKIKKAVSTWQQVAEVSPALTYLTFSRLAQVAARSKDLKLIETFLSECAASHADPLAHLALARLLAQKGEIERAIQEFKAAIELDPGLFSAGSELGRLLIGQGRSDEALETYRQLLENLKPPEPIFQCHRCGFLSKELVWRCPQCHGWDTLKLTREHEPTVADQETVKSLSR